MSIKKTVSKDEIDIHVYFENNHLKNIEVNVKDESIFAPLDLNNVMLLNQIRDMVANGIVQTLSVINRNRMVEKQKQERKAVILKDKKCPNCGGELELKQPCCNEKKKLLEKGIVAILSCGKCGQKLWVKQEEYKQLLGE